MTSSKLNALAFEAALRVDDPEALYEQAPCGYLSTGADGLVLKVNQTFLAMTGHTAADLVGKLSLVDLLTVGSRLYHETHVRPLLHLNGSVAEIALDLRRIDGSVQPVLVNAVMDTGSDPSSGTVRLAVFDATERRRYERELVAAKKRAEESERHLAVVARTLQETLTPPKDPHIDGMVVASAYRPAGRGDEIGGDFYDVFEVDPGTWIVVMGDVAGKGVEAAVVATLARHTLRAVAITETSTARMVDQVNRVVLGHETDRFLTAAVLRLRRSPTGWEVTMTVAGHPPAVLLHDVDEAITLGESGHLVGAFDFATYEELHFRIAPGSTLVLHTDGITDGRSPDGEFYGEDRLRRVLVTGSLAPQDLVERVLNDVLDHQQQRARDDIALLALQVPGNG